MTTGTDMPTHPLREEVLLLLRVAMAVFVWTVAIGILNGADLVDFSRKVVLSHVHAGTLGWITTCVFAASLWLFGGGATEGQHRAARWLTWAAVVTLPVFAFTFAFTYGDARAVLGTVALATIVGFFAWVVVRARSVTLTTVHLGFLAAVATSVVGGVLGVLLATKIATGRDVLPSGGEDAHPATMVVGFLIPVGMALAEWGLRGSPTEPAGRLGRAQIGLPFLGGLLLMVGLLADIDPLPPLAALVELAGVVIFLIRMLPAIRSVAWGVRAPARYAAASSLAIVANIVFINYLAAANGGDFDKVPQRQLLALDHMMFIGVLTNAIFAMLILAGPLRSRLQEHDTAVFVGLNVGLVGFVVSFLSNT
ncbi:MAG: hypothetical protein AB7O29_13425, partial [Acidimicrobiia bacterium]